MQHANSPHTALETLQRAALGQALLAGLALLVVAAALAGALALGVDYVIKVTLLFAAALAWLGRYLPDHLPHMRTGPANQVTLARLALTALLGGMLGEPSPSLAWPAVGLAALVLLLDGADGWLARRGGWSSGFGARFDMETDALLMLLMAALAWQFGKAGAWILLAGLLRYAFVAAGLAWPWLRRPLPESLRRKTLCVVPILALLAALMPAVPMPLSALIAGTGLALLCWSFLVDVAWLYRHAVRAASPAIGRTPRMRRSRHPAPATPKETNRDE